MAGVPPNSLRETELPEFPIRGPFGGVQSEVSDEAVERFGFSDCVNVIFRKAAFMTRPGFVSYDTGSEEPILGLASFIDISGNRLQVAFTATKLLQWNGFAQVWTVVESGYNGVNNYEYDTLAGKLCFCNGRDGTKFWTGSGLPTVVTVPARHMMELDNHLLIANTIEDGGMAPQRLRWSGISDPSDWNSLNSGQQDLFNNLGPVNGLLKLGQQGFAWQMMGVTRIDLTGLGLRPFAFTPLSAHAKGLTVPQSLCAYGENLAAYIGKDNIYVFDGIQSTPIGDRAVDGSLYRAGARRRIFADLVGSDLSKVFAGLTTSINGYEFFGYWIFIPGVGSWVYNFDEMNWTKFTYDKTPTCCGLFSASGSPRIMDLSGLVSAQAWTPIDSVVTNPLDGFGVGMSDGTVETLNMGSFAGSGEWNVKTGQMVFGDLRHEKSVVNLRVVYKDVIANVQVTFAVTNERGQTETKKYQFGTGDGLVKTLMVPIKIAGMYLKLNVSGNNNMPVHISEITSIYSVGTEQRGGNGTLIK